MTKKLFAVEVVGLSEPINILHDSGNEAIDFVMKTVLADVDQVKIVSEHIPTEAEAHEAQKGMDYMIAIHSNLILRTASYILLDLTNISGMEVGSDEFNGKIEGIRELASEISQHGGICEEFANAVNRFTVAAESANLDSVGELEALYKEVVTALSNLVSEYSLDDAMDDILDRLVQSVS